MVKMNFRLLAVFPGLYDVDFDLSVKIEIMIPKAKNSGFLRSRQPGFSY
jgi:hypothetical protein